MVEQKRTCGCKWIMALWERLSAASAADSSGVQT